MFRGIGYQSDIDLFGFSYDWRLTLPTFTTVNNETDSTLFAKFKDLIEKAYNVNNLKVTIITHSMGGLLVN